MTNKEQITYDEIMTKSFVAGFIAGLIGGAMFTLAVIAVFYL
jgi:hypothetical protein